jgi:hypothetical protein
MVMSGNLDIALVLESELDVILLGQEARDLAMMIALGNASSRPDQDAHNLLCRASRILVALDTDDAGAKQAWQWWPQNYPKVKRWPCVYGKDPGEMKKAGINIRCWVEAGLMA